MFNRRRSVSLFPFLNVLLCLMGVLATIAVVLSLFHSTTTPPAAQQPLVEIQLVGAPAHVKPQLISCRNDQLEMKIAEQKLNRQFNREDLQQEISFVKGIVNQVVQRAQSSPSREELQLIFSSLFEGGYDMPFQNGFVSVMHFLDRQNQDRSTKKARVSYYPLFLVYPDGIAICDQAMYLMEMTSNLASGVEPMLPGWVLPQAREIF